MGDLVAPAGDSGDFYPVPAGVVLGIRLWLVIVSYRESAGNMSVSCARSKAVVAEQRTPIKPCHLQTPVEGTFGWSLVLL